MRLKKLIMFKSSETFLIFFSCFINSWENRVKINYDVNLSISSFSSVRFLHHIFKSYINRPSTCIIMFSWWTDSFISMKHRPLILVIRLIFISIWQYSHSFSCVWSFNGTSLLNFYFKHIFWANTNKQNIKQTAETCDFDILKI